MIANHRITLPAPLTGKFGRAGSQHLVMGLALQLSAIVLLVSHPDHALGGQHLMLAPPNINALRWLVSALPTLEDLHGF